MSRWSGRDWFFVMAGAAILIYVAYGAATDMWREVPTPASSVAEQPAAPPRPPAKQFEISGFTCRTSDVGITEARGQVQNLTGRATRIRVTVVFYGPNRIVLDTNYRTLPDPLSRDKIARGAWATFEVPATGLDLGTRVSDCEVQAEAR